MADSEQPQTVKPPAEKKQQPTGPTISEGDLTKYKVRSSPIVAWNLVLDTMGEPGY